MKILLVPIDYSANAKSALLYALRLARQADLRVVVFHALYQNVTPDVAYNNPLIVPDLERARGLELEQYVHACKKEQPNDLVLHFNSSFNKRTSDTANDPYHTIQEEKVQQEEYTWRIMCVAKLGRVEELLPAVAEAYEADLLVMGLQGGGALSEVLIGGTTLFAMRHSQVPVLGVPLRARFRGLRSIVYAADLTRQPDELQLNRMRDLVTTFGAKLEVLHLYKHQNRQAAFHSIEPALQVLDKQLYDINFTVVVQQQPDIATGIQEYLQQSKADLVLLHPTKHTLFQRLSNKSVTAKLATLSYMPLLALPSQQTGAWEPEQLPEKDFHQEFWSGN